MDPSVLPSVPETTSSLGPSPAARSATTERQKTTSQEGGYKHTHVTVVDKNVGDLSHKELVYETTHEIVSDEEHGKGSGNKKEAVGPFRARQGPQMTDNRRSVDNENAEQCLILTGLHTEVGKGQTVYNKEEEVELARADIVVVAFTQKMDAADKGAKRDKGQSDNLADRKGRKLKDGRELTQLGEMRDHTLQIASHGKDCRDNSIGQQKAK